MANVFQLKVFPAACAGQCVSTTTGDPRVITVASSYNIIIIIIMALRRILLGKTKLVNPSRRSDNTRFPGPYLFFRF